MLKVAIVGCGKIADSHASQLGRIKGCEIVGVCDREELMAKQLFQRFPIKQYFTDFDELMREAEPDVVHITTPPQHHVALAKKCLQAGAHAYVEKPFSLNTKEAVELIDLAQRQGLKITPGHDDQFSHVARRMREQVRRGYLGGPPVHMECHYCYPLSSEYAAALFGDANHWVRKLPGRLLHNIISHGIARVAEYFESSEPQVIAHGFTSPFLRNIGETEIIDELRVIISEGNHRTAYFTCSSQMRPTLHQFRIYGPKNALFLDQDTEILLKIKGSRYKSYAEKFIPPVNIAGQCLENLIKNARTFLAADFHMKSGMKYLIESFYTSIMEGTPLPISYREILLTSRIMDAIFAQLSVQLISQFEHVRDADSFQL